MLLRSVIAVPLPTHCIHLFFQIFCTALNWSRNWLIHWVTHLFTNGLHVLTEYWLTRDSFTELSNFSTVLCRTELNWPSWELESHIYGAPPFKKFLVSSQVTSALCQLNSFQNTPEVLEVSVFWLNERRAQTRHHDPTTPCLGNNTFIR
jgi:hypothetical protein